MRLPWECKHDKIKIERLDQGVDKFIKLLCKNCKKPLGEQVEKNWKVLNES